MTDKNNATSDEARFETRGKAKTSFVERLLADIKLPEEPNWIITDDGHGTADERGIYIPAYGEGSGKAILIEWTAIDKPMKLLQITRRLLHKQWITREMCSAFLDITFQHFDWPKGCPYP